MNLSGGKGRVTNLVGHKTLCHKFVTLTVTTEGPTTSKLIVNFYETLETYFHKTFVLHNNRNLTISSALCPSPKLPFLLESSPFEESHQTRTKLTESYGHSREGSDTYFPY